MKMHALFATAALAAFCTPGTASAATYVFALTGDYAASWQMDSDPLPDSVYDSQGFAIERVTGQFPGSFAGAAYLDFFSLANGGGLSIWDADDAVVLSALKGDQLYTNDEASPIMKLGTFVLKDENGQGSYSLQVGTLAAAVPEPSTWAMMILGFGVVGGAMRLRARRTTVRYV